MVEKKNLVKVKRTPKVSNVKIKPKKSSKGMQSASRSSDLSSKEPSTMDEILSLYGSTTFSFTVGDIVKGKIISIEPGRVLIDIGGKSEGLVAEKAYKEAESFIKNLNVGDEVDARVLVSETSDGYTILSLRQAKEKAVWEKIIESEEKSLPLTVEGKGVNPAGVTVEISGMTGFIPTSQLGKGVSDNPQKLIGNKFQAVVIDYQKDSRKIILSEKEISEKEELAAVREEIKKIKEGDVFEGEIEGVFDFGCFVKINAGTTKKDVPLDGLVHISELSWEKISDPNEGYNVGDKVRVKVIGKNLSGGRKGTAKLAFSIKQAQEDPWEKIEEKYKKEKQIKAKVTRVSGFGVFVQLEPGVEGLIHMTKVPPGRKFTKGESVDVYIEEVGKEDRKIALGLVLKEKPVGYK